jgi:hypothetical protein
LNTSPGIEGALEVPELLKTNFPDLAKLFEGVMNEPLILAHLKNS